MAAAILGVGRAAPDFRKLRAGNVGIGTTNPSFKLDVAGQINTSVGVSLNGTLYANPDYVFEPDYPLLPLDEFEAFTVSNKHLPHVPSTKDVKKKGALRSSNRTGWYWRTWRWLPLHLPVEWSPLRSRKPRSGPCAMSCGRSSPGSGPRRPEPISSPKITIYAFALRLAAHLLGGSRG